MQHEHQQTHHRHELGKTVLPVQAWALAVGAIIGWGCFILPGTRFLPCSGPLASLIGLAVGAVALSIVALCYGIMIKAYPVAGGAFAYAFVGLGRLAAVVCGWGLALSYSCVILNNVVITWGIKRDNLGFRFCVFEKFCNFIDEYIAGKGAARAPL